MKTAAYALFTGALLVAVCSLLGNTVLRTSKTFLGRLEALVLSFLTGSAILGALTFTIAGLGIARRGISIGVSAVLLAVSVWSKGYQFPARRVTDAPWPWRAAFWIAGAIFAALYLSIALAPPVDLQNSILSEVAVWARHQAAPWNEASPVSALYLYGFTIGRHSGTSITALCFLAAIALGLRCLGERLGSPKAAILGALLFFISPLVGRLGTAATMEIPLAALTLGLFYAINIRMRLPSLVLAASLIASILPWLIANQGSWTSLDLQSWTVVGGTGRGVIGPVFFLLPLALFALQTAAGRWLLSGAAIACVPLVFVPQLPTLVIALPFWCAALAMVLTEWQGTAPIVLAVHTLFSWPAVMPLYVERQTWRIPRLEWRAALGIETEDRYLMGNLRGYHIGRQMEEMIPDGEVIVALAPFQTAYHSREIRYQAAWPESPEELGRSGAKWVLVSVETKGAMDMYQHATDWQLEVKLAEEGWILMRVL